MLEGFSWSGRWMGDGIGNASTVIVPFIDVNETVSYRPK